MAYRVLIEPVKKLFNEIAPAFEGRNGGYTRVKSRFSQRDNALMAVIQFVEESTIKPKKDCYQSQRSE